MNLSARLVTGYGEISSQRGCCPSKALDHHTTFCNHKLSRLVTAESRDLFSDLPKLWCFTRTMATRGSSRSKPPAGPTSRTPSDKSGVDKCQVFYHSLSDKLEALEQAVQPKWLTLEWVSLAVDFMRSTFSDMMILFEDVRVLMPDVKVSDEFWIEEYMVESMKLLDVCNVLKPAVSRFEHFMMCVQLVVPAIQRCAVSSHEHHQTLISALQTCESELTQLIHPPLTTLSPLSPPPSPSPSTTDALLRHASIAIGETFTDGENLFDNAPRESPFPLPLRRSGSGSGNKRGTVALTLVMRATRETTEFVASVLIWALKRDPSSHPGSTCWQRNLEVFGGEDAVGWSASFRRLQERLRKELFEAMRNNQRQQFVFVELKMVEGCVVGVRGEVEGDSGERERERAAASRRRLEGLGEDLRGLLDTIQVRLDKVASQVNQLFDQLVQARKKLLDAAQQRTSSIHRAYTF